MRIRILFILLVAFGVLCIAGESTAQTKSGKNSKPKTPSTKPVPAYPPVHILGLRPGITFDSVAAVLKIMGGQWREVTVDTLTRNYGDKNVKVYVLDSIYVRFSYMRMAFVFDQSSNRLRRIALTPRLSSVIAGRNDDLSEVLLLYFGQTWGKPEIQLDLTPAYYRWARGNIEVKGYIRRGYPLWVLEG